MRNGNYIGTYNGGRFWVTDPHTDDVDIEAISHALSQNCRYTGHTSTLWTVAQHSLLVSDILEQSNSEYKDILSLIGLLHDASEGYMSDIASPFKYLLSQYLDMENKVQNVILNACGINTIDENLQKIVKSADLLALHIEANELMNPCDDWLSWGDFNNPEINKWTHKIKTENPQIVQGKFIAKLYSLLEKNNLLENSTVFNKLNMDWLNNYKENLIPIFQNGQCKCYLKEKNNKYYVYVPFYKGVFKKLKKNTVDNSINLFNLFDYQL